MGTEAPRVAEPETEIPQDPAEQPFSFAGGRYRVNEFLGEGGKKLGGRSAMPQSHQRLYCEESGSKLGD